MYWEQILELFWNWWMSDYYCWSSGGKERLNIGTFDRISATIENYYINTGNKINKTVAYKEETTTLLPKGSLIVRPGELLIK